MKRGSMTLSQIACSLLIILAAGVCAGEEPPTADEIVRGMIEAAGGENAFRQLGLLQVDITTEETTTAGKTHKGSMTGFVSTVELDAFRLVPRQGLILVRNGDDGWAMMGGKLDSRPQTPGMAKGTVHATLVPLLFPYCLDMKGVNVSYESTGSAGGTPAWRLQVEFGASFFASPVMNTTWSVFVSKEDYSFLGASYRPPAEYAKTEAEGVRYRYLTTQTIGNVQLPSEIIMEGLYANGLENGHSKVVKISASVRDWDSSLFLNPEQLKAIEEQEEEPDFS